MPSPNPWPLFPSNLDPCVVRSLSIQFLLQNLLDFFDLLRSSKTRHSPLDKLCFYSEILLEASHISDHELLVILEEMRNALPKPHSRTEKKESAPDFHPHLCRFFSALLPFLQEVRFDENVLLYLIEHKDRFNAHLGPRRIEELLHSFFPAGPAQLRAVIYEGYTRRGFSDFLSSVEPLIDAIEWETPCHSPMKL